MRIVAVSLISALLVSACSQKSDSAVSPVPQGSVDDGMKPHFELVASDLMGPAVISTNLVGNPHSTIVIDIQLSAAKAAEFGKFTQDHLRQQVQLICDSKVVAEPFVASPITGGRLQVTFSSLEQARVVEELLNKKR